MFAIPKIVRVQADQGADGVLKVERFLPMFPGEGAEHNVEVVLQFGRPFHGPCRPNIACVFNASALKKPMNRSRSTAYCGRPSGADVLQRGDVTLCDGLPEVTDVGHVDEDKGKPRSTS